MAFTILNRLRGRADPHQKLRPLYLALIAKARETHWYLAGGVPDTNDGRFAMIALTTALALNRLDDLGEAARAQTALLAELFVEDMEGQIREMGIGDVVVGKYVGKMMSALGGQMAAYRDGLADGGDLDDALRRNLYAGVDAEPAAIAHSAAEVRQFVAVLDRCTLDRLLSGDFE